MTPDDSRPIGPVNRWSILATIAIIALVAVSAWLPGCGDDEDTQGTTTSVPAVTQTGGFDSSVPVSVPAGPGYTVMEDTGE